MSNNFVTVDQLQDIETILGSMKILSNKNDNTGMVYNMSVANIAEFIKDYINTNTSDTSIKIWSGIYIEYNELLTSNTLDEHTLYFITDKSQIYYNSVIILNLENLYNVASNIILNGDGTKFLSNNGEYKLINQSPIVDTEASSTSTYSSSKIDSKITGILDTIVLPTQDNAPTMWQKTYVNVNSGDVLKINTVSDEGLSTAMIQVYKFVPGETGKVSVLKTFNNADASNFYYDSNNVIFEDDIVNGGKMKIKDGYVLHNSLSSDGYYETEVIDKSMYFDIHSFVTELL